MGIHRLVDQRQRRLQSLVAPIQRGRKPPVRAKAAKGEDRTPTPPTGIGKQPLELPHLVAAPATRAEGAVFLDPDPEPGKLANRRRPRGEIKVRQGLGKGWKALMQVGGQGEEGE